MPHSWRSIAACLLAIAGSASADHLDLSVTPQLKENCHIVRFPQGWKVPGGPGPIFRYGSYDDYEFRVPGLQGTKFMMAGLIHLPEVRNTTNRYEVDFSDPKAAIRNVSEEAWKAGTPVRLRQDMPEVQPYLLGQRPLAYHNLSFEKTGEFWAKEGDWLSPDGDWLVLQSWTGSADMGGDSGFGNCLPFGCRGRFFVDVYNAHTAKKIFTITGAYKGGDPNGMLSKTGWVTERYFIVPLGEHRERCLVCDFGAGGQRLDANR